MADPRPIGIFDSGVGGLSVWREIVKQLPQESTLYFADQAHVPYGPRGEEQIRHFSDRITRFLLARDCKAVVVACNTASAAALKYLRETFPDVPSIGMEPAVKPAAESTRSKVVGIMATPATFQGRLFKATAGRHARDIKLINRICEGLAEHVEAGVLNGAETETLLRGFIQPMLDESADTIVLACSHYPFVIDTVRRIAGPEVNVIDPAPAVARQVQRVLGERGLLASDESAPEHSFHTTGSGQAFERALGRLVQRKESARCARWMESGELAAQ